MEREDLLMAYLKKKKKHDTKTHIKKKMSTLIRVIRKNKNSERERERENSQFCVEKIWIE